MDFEEELFNLYKTEAEKSRQDFITEHGYTKVSEMSHSDRSFYEINRANTTKGALRRFFDRLNCGGYAFEIDTRLYPPKNNDLSRYISSILDNFSFVRLLGDSTLQSDEYLVLYRFTSNFGHHFVKVNSDGLLTEKAGYGNPKIFEGWYSRFIDSPEVIFAVKKDHLHHCSSSLDFSNGLNFSETVQQAMSDRHNTFSYHSQNYSLKKSPSGQIFVVNKDSTIVASVMQNSSAPTINILSDYSDSIENLSGHIKPYIKNGKLLNLDDYTGKSKEPQEL